MRRIRGRLERIHDVRDMKSVALPLMIDHFSPRSAPAEFEEAF